MVKVLKTKSVASIKPKFGPTWPWQENTYLYFVVEIVIIPRRHRWLMRSGCGSKLRGIYSNTSWGGCLSSACSVVCGALCAVHYKGVITRSYLQNYVFNNSRSSLNMCYVYINTVVKMLERKLW